VNPLTPLLLLLLLRRPSHPHAPALLLLLLRPAARLLHASVHL
jgi:hypothetical protein